MKTISQVRVKQVENVSENDFTVDTTFVLFFLAIEFGQTLSQFGFDTILLAITLGSIAVLPYFLPMNNKPKFGSWLVGRGLIAGLAILLGLAFKQSLGVFLPETFRFLPMTLLIVTAMMSCYFQFYGFLKLRFVK
ncbi:MAG: hypothetical protein K1X72_02455 [Pyrinomonadaceae bacterium]|nr:hypothetical protein [Pyrinomonadaceae bacterium]